LEEETRQVLSREEQKKADTFVKEEDRKRYVFSHLYLRKILSSYVPELAPSEWYFSHNLYGKPAIANSMGKTLHFNLSHTHSCAYVIVSTLADCGIDVEEKKKLEITEGLRALVFSKEELDYYAAAEEQEILFYRLWTLKEAHLKAFGSGLMETAPHELNFEGKINLARKQNHFSMDEAQYWSLSLENGCFLSFCILHTQKQLHPLYRDHRELN